MLRAPACAARFRGARGCEARICPELQRKVHSPALWRMRHVIRAGLPRRPSRDNICTGAHISTARCVMPQTPFAPADSCDVHCLHPEVVRAARAALLSSGEAQDLAAIFSVLADPTRVRLVQALAERELCVCDLANVVGLRQSTV